MYVLLGLSCICKLIMRIALVILSDLIFALLPPIMLRGLQINFRVKLALFGITSLGILYGLVNSFSIYHATNFVFLPSAAIASLVKTSFMYDYGKTGDFLYDSRNLSVWSVMEMTIGIMAGSFPALKPLFRRFLRTSSSGSNYASNKFQNTGGYAIGDEAHRSRRSIRRSKQEHIDHEMQGFDLYVKQDISTGVVVFSRGTDSMPDMNHSDSGSEPIPATKMQILKTTTVEITSHQADYDDCRSTMEIV